MIMCRAVLGTTAFVLASVSPSALYAAVPINSPEARELVRDFLIKSHWLRGDLDGDGQVGPADLTDMLQLVSEGHSTEGQGTLVDLNSDGVIDILDLQTLLQHWGEVRGFTWPDGRQTPLTEESVIEILIAEGLIDPAMAEELVAANSTTHILYFSSQWSFHQWSTSRNWTLPLSSPGRPRDNHSYSISSTWFAPTNHATIASDMFPANHLARVSSDWGTPGVHATATSAERGWPANHEVSVSIGWPPSHAIASSRFWPSSHAVAQSSTLQPSTHAEFVSATWNNPLYSQPAHAQDVSAADFPPNHFVLVSRDNPPTHQASLSQTYPPNHHSFVTASWPPNRPWPAGHVVVVSHSWEEPPPPSEPNGPHNFLVSESTRRYLPKSDADLPTTFEP